MAIPNNQVSTQTHRAAWREQVRDRNEYLRDYEVGGIALNDGTQGMQVRQWVARVVAEEVDGVVGSRIEASNDNGVTWNPLLTRPGVRVTEICLAFDNNMNPFVGFVEEGGAAYRWWFDSISGVQTLTLLPAGTRSPRACTDEKRRVLQADTDICFMYIRGTKLFVTYQRERYATEHELATGLSTTDELVAVQMNVERRLQWMLSEGGDQNWVLPEVIEEICRRANLPRRLLNQTTMDWSKVVRGYTIGSGYQAAGILQALASIFFFDPANANGKVAFVPRGRDAVATIVEEDMVDDGDDDIVEDSQSRRQDSIGVPRVLHLNYYDVAGGLNTDKQRSERPEGTRAEGEQSLQTPVVLSADEAASI
ncbi:MAG TPA: phage tail protein, partial [Lysobacter sp.]